jgi:hypothetical protein
LDENLPDNVYQEEQKKLSGDPSFTNNLSTQTETHARQDAELKRESNPQRIKSGE